MEQESDSVAANTMSLYVSIAICGAINGATLPASLLDLRKLEFSLAT
jgi:hypothetical protein